MASHACVTFHTTTCCPGTWSGVNWLNILPWDGKSLRSALCTLTHASVALGNRLHGTITNRAHGNKSKEKAFIPLLGLVVEHDGVERLHRRRVLPQPIEKLEKNPH